MAFYQMLADKLLRNMGLHLKRLSKASIGLKSNLLDLLLRWKILNLNLKIMKLIELKNKWFGQLFKLQKYKLQFWEKLLEKKILLHLSINLDQKAHSQ